MNKRLLLLCFTALLISLPGHAVLKEANLDTTLYILRNELTNYHLDLERRNKGQQERLNQVNQEMGELMNQANQNAVMLYSQRSGYIFDLTYACHEATEQFHKFKNRSLPFRRIIARNNLEVARFDSLITNLSSMPTMFMSDNARIDRNVCLTLAVNIRRQLVENQQQLQDYIQFYDMAERKLRNMNDYATKRYNDIQSSLITNDAGNYLKVLMNFGSNIKRANEAVGEKYRPIGSFRHIISQWDVRVIFMLFTMILFYLLISIVLNIVTIRFLVTYLVKKGKFARIKDSFIAKRPCIMMTMTVVTFAIILGILRLLVSQNFIIMASDLLVSYAWLLGVILLSLLLRVNGDQIKSAFRIYTPLMVMGFFVFTVRIVLIPNDLMNLIFPPLMLFCALWQWSVIRRHGKNVPKSDMLYAWITLAVFTVSVVTSWMGYALFSVVLLIWWIMQLTFILTITCLGLYLRIYAEKKALSAKPITRTWFYHLIYNGLLPVAGVCSIPISIYWAADVFNLSDAMFSIFNHHYIDLQNFSVSLFTICLISITFFVFSYINHTAQAFLKLHFEKSDLSTAASKMVMSTNLLQVVVWGVWLLLCMNLCHVGSTWLSVAGVGLSTGIGIASKNIIENIFYGISLMSGRVKIGDYIVCDGIRGRVNSISYTSTMIEGTDGSVIAFQNSQLFNKNYKNMTKNHGYELDIMEVGVAYGTNIQKVKRLLIDNLMQLECVYKKKGVKVVLKSFDDSCITLKVLVWVNVLTQYADDGKIMECIYQTLNDNHIEIPFPQREITIKNASETEQHTADSLQETDSSKKGTESAKER